DLLTLRLTARDGHVANAVILQDVSGYVLDPLLRPGVALHENRAERFVALEQLHDGRCQTRTIEWSAEPDNRGDVIRRGVGLQLLEEPDSLLRERKRGPLPRCQPANGQRCIRCCGVSIDPCGHPLDRRMLEEHP